MIGAVQVYSSQRCHNHSGAMIRGDVSFSLPRRQQSTSTRKVGGRGRPQGQTPGEQMTAARRHSSSTTPTFTASWSPSDSGCQFAGWMRVNHHQWAHHTFRCRGTSELLGLSWTRPFWICIDDRQQGDDATWIEGRQLCKS